MNWGEAVNNDIGWGQGYTQSDWGNVYTTSWSGDTLLLSDEDETPINTVSPVITGISQVGQTLNCSTGTWSNTPTSYTYQWKRNNISITGATSSTYTLVSADANSSIKCTVTATNDDGSASADSDTVNVTWETDAQAFITAAAITDPTQQSAVNQLVLDLKSANIWTKMKAFYPLVGGTASTCKWNLVNPLDTDAAFRLTFNGGITFTNGLLSNGTNGYANTHIIPNTSLIQNDSALFYKSTTNIIGNYAEFGAFSTNAFALYQYQNDYTCAMYTNGGTGSATNNQGTSTGVRVGSRTASNSLKLYRDGSLLATTTGSAGNLSGCNRKLYLGALHDTGGIPNFFTPRNLTVAGVSSGLSDSEVSSLTTIINVFDSTLGR